MRPPWILALSLGAALVCASAGLSVASAATAGNGEAPTAASSVPRPEGSPAHFLSRIVRLLVANRYSEAWRWLDPADQKLAPEPVYVTCESLTPVLGRLVSLRTLHVGHDRIGVAVRFRLRIADEAQMLETTVLITAHAVVAPGRWAWILPQARRTLYRNGCDLGSPPNPITPVPNPSQPQRWQR
jgi:hypothetical protein